MFDVKTTKEVLHVAELGPEAIYELLTNKVLEVLNYDPKHFKAETMVIDWKINKTKTGDVISGCTIRIKNPEDLSPIERHA